MYANHKWSSRGSIPGTRAGRSRTSRVRCVLASSARGGADAACSDVCVVILDDSLKCIDDCMAKATKEHGIDPHDVKAIGIANQRQTTAVWDKNTGEPLHGAIVWNDMRTAEMCNELRDNLDEQRVTAISGLPISTYFSGVKLRWLMKNVPAVSEAIEAGTALFGTIDTWLAWNLTQNKVHITDVTNAGGTMLMDLKTLNWSDELLDMLEVPRAILPEIRSCSEEYGLMAHTVLKGVKIAGIMGDQQAALVGQGCFDVGMGKNTYGTGCFFVYNTGTEPRVSSTGLLTIPAYKMGPNEPCFYALEGSVNTAGAAVTWLRDKLGIINSAGEMEELASAVEDTGDMYFVPAFSGLFAPRWREDARGCMVGLSGSTNRLHIARATLESMAFQVNDVLNAVATDTGRPIQELRVDGGASVNNLLLQMQADITGLPVLRPVVVETTALGAAYAAGLAVGVFTSMEDFRTNWTLDQDFPPMIGESELLEKLRKWEAAVERSLGWITRETEMPPGVQSVSTGSDFVVRAAILATGAVAGFVVSNMLKSWRRAS